MAEETRTETAKGSAGGTRTEITKGSAGGSRTETDSLGTIDIPAERYWGPQTERARRLFRIGSERFPPGLIRAVGLHKWACAEANGRLGELPRRSGRADQAGGGKRSPTARAMPNSRCPSGRPAAARRPT